MNDSNQIRAAFAHYRYRRASQLLEGDSDAHWVIAYQHADELIDFDSFEAAWVLQESAITAQREALAQMKTERDQYDELHLESIALAARHEQALARVEAERDSVQIDAMSYAEQRDTAQAQLAEAVGLLKFLEDEFQGFGSATRKISDFLARHAQSDQQEALSDAELMEVAMFEGSGNKAARRANALGAAELPEHLAPQQEAQGAQAGDERAGFKKEYDAFRQWAGSRLTARQLDLDEVGLFYDEIAGFAHDAWQARAALATQPAVRGAEHE